MTKLCPRGKAAAKRKFAVYPSAYANAYASKICAGKIKDPSGKKRKDFKGPKPAGAKKGAMMIIIGIGKKKKPVKARFGAAVGAIGAGAGVIGAAAARANKKFSDKVKAKKRDKMKVQKKMGGGISEKTKTYALAQSMKDKDRLTKRDMQEAKDILKGDRYKALNVSKPMIAALKEARDFRSAYKRDKAKVQKKMSGGMPTAGGMSAMGRLQKARMMNQGGFGEPYSTNINKNIPRTKPKVGDKNRARPRNRAKEKGIIRNDNRYSGGGLARGGGAAVRGTNFEGVF